MASTSGCARGRRNYLTVAADSGVLRYLGDRPYVSGHYVDPASDEHQFLVEYCDPRILSDPVTFDALITEATGDADATHMVLRVGPEIADLSPPWWAYQTYVRYVGPPIAAPDRTVVRPAHPAETPLVADWLALTTREAAADQDMLSEQFDAAASTADWMNASDRRSFIYLEDAHPAGHVTLLIDAYDDVYDEEFVDLIDIMVDPQYDTHAGTRALTAASIECAARLGRSLIGNVVHPANDTDGQAERIIQQLIDTGWVVAYRFWKRPL